MLLCSSNLQNNVVTYTAFSKNERLFFITRTVICIFNTFIWTVVVIAAIIFKYLISSNNIFSKAKKIAFSIDFFSLIIETSLLVVLLLFLFKSQLKHSKILKVLNIIAIVFLLFCLLHRTGYILNQIFFDNKNILINFISGISSNGIDQQKGCIFQVKGLCVVRTVPLLFLIVFLFLVILFPQKCKKSFCKTSFLLPQHIAVCVLFLLFSLITVL